MKREAGTTIVELLIATGIMLAATAAVFTLVGDATLRSARWNESADLHQRARIAVDAITRLVALSAAAPPTAGLLRAFPAIEPRRRSSFLASASAITVRHVPEAAAWTYVTADVPPGAVTATIRNHTGCADGVVNCGFAARTGAAILDGRGDWHLLFVEPSAPGVLAIADAIPGRAATFPAGAAIVEMLETSLYFDRRERTLRQEGPGEGSFPIVDNIAEIVFEYFATGPEPLPLASLIDGPLCGSGSLAYDCDLHRVRTIRATVAVTGSNPEMRPLELVVEVARRVQ
jgi:hypothetical protein